MFIVLWERGTCTIVGHLSFSHRLSINVTHVKASTNIVGTQLLVCSHHSFKRLGISLCRPHGRQYSVNTQFIGVCRLRHVDWCSVCMLSWEFSFCRVENNLANGLVK